MTAEFKNRNRHDAYLTDKKRMTNKALIDSLHTFLNGEELYEAEGRQMIREMIAELYRRFVLNNERGEE